jgi:uncharacterized membrane protein YdbT with pleckstrin-like domain
MTVLIQAVAGLTSPEIAEMRIREVWPSVARMPLVAKLGKMLTRTIILAPLGWLIMSGAYFGKLLPIIGVRYALTNRRVLIKRGWKGTPKQEVPLSEIEDVELDEDSVDNFFRCADLRILRTGSTPLVLTAVPDAESFRHAILAARNAWVPGKAKTLPFISAAATK